MLRLVFVYPPGDWRRWPPSEWCWRPGWRPRAEDRHETGHHGRVVGQHIDQNHATGMMKCNPSLTTLPTRGRLSLGWPTRPRFLASIVNEEKHGQVVHDRRHQGHLDDGQVAGVGELGHQKGAGTHDGRHQLTTGGGGRFDGAGHMGPVADFFHHRDGEGARGRPRCRRPSRTSIPEARGHHRCFGRSPGEAAGEGIGQFDEKSCPPRWISRKAPKRTKTKTKVAATPMGSPKMPSVVSHKVVAMRSML
jgi:hypothetical protein